MKLQQVLFEVSDEIATVTLNRPESLNALSPQMSAELDQALAEVKDGAGKEIKVLIMTGAGRAFCAGGDVKSMNAAPRTPQTMRKGLRGMHQRLYNIANLELPVISLVDGVAAGAGANIALAADFVLATPRAMFMQAFGRIGLVPDYGGMFILPRLVGLQKAKELVFTARKVGAEEARDLGMVHSIVSQESAMAEARTFAGRFRHASTEAIGIAKNILNQSFNLDHRTILELEASGQAVCASTDFHQEAVRRFANKEPALFDWEALCRESD